MFERFPVPAREQYEAALRTRDELRAELAQFFAANAFDALVFPPAPIPPPPQGDHATVEILGAQVPVVAAMGRAPSVGSVGGLASLVLPAGLTRSGLPIGLEFAAAAGSDRRLLSIGLTLESILGPVLAPQPTANRSRHSIAQVEQDS
jgi:mandelamide amidase